MLQSVFRINLILMLTYLSACSTTSWFGHPKPSQQKIEQVLNGELSQMRQWDLPIEQQPNFMLPQKLRPCCAFGNEMKTKVGRVPIPFYRLHNTVDRAAVGPHRYDAGSFTNTTYSANDNRGSEKNGQIYTLKGGFIDLAHVRDTADDTVALFFQVLRYIGTSHRIELSGEIGSRYIQLYPMDLQSLDAEQRWKLAAELAARLAYFKAESHEIAQWRGLQSVPGFSEEISAYSPEDVYSNMLGAKIAVALIHAQLVSNTDLYNQNMTVWLDAALQWLGALEVEDTNRLMLAVDGHWWDSSRRVPNKFLILKRHYEMGAQQIPNRVTADLFDSDTPLFEQLSTHQAHPLQMTPELYGFELDHLGQLWMAVKPKFSEAFAHVPTSIWQDGFSHIEYNDIAYWDKIEDGRQLRALQ